MGWVVKLDDDHHVNLDDIPIDVFDTIASEEPDATWWGVYTWPGGSSTRLHAVVCAAADIAGVPHPPYPATMREANRFLARLDEVEDIEEKPMIDGFPPMPAVPEVGFSSGAPGGSDGLLTLFANNVSVIFSTCSTRKTRFLEAIRAAA
jgi:hypothetical protein